MQWEFYDRASPGYAYSRAVIFAVIGVVCLIVGTFTNGGVSLFGVFCLVGTVVWILNGRRTARKARRATD